MSNTNQLKELLENFAVKIGTDHKILDGKKADKAEVERINQAINTLKSELLGGDGMDETLDTIKEISEKLKELQSSNVGEAMLSKLQELKTEIDTLKQLNEIDDLVAIYERAKG